MKKWHVWCVGAAVVIGYLSVCVGIGMADPVKYEVKYVDEKGKTFTAADVLVSTETAKFSVTVNQKLTKSQWSQVIQDSITKNVLFVQRDGLIMNELTALLKMINPPAQNQQQAQSQTQPKQQKQK